MSDKIIGRFIIQVAGKPAKNVDKALEIVEKKLKEEKRFKVLESHCMEAELDEESKLYSGFLEVTLRFDSLRTLFEFILDYTPSSIEIEDPQKLTLDLASLNAVLNDFSSHILRLSHHIRILNANIHHRDKKLEELGVSIQGKEKKKSK